MARGVLANQDLVHTGLVAATYTAADATDGHQFLNTGNGKDLILHIKNGGAGATVCTIGIVAKVEGKYEADATGNSISIGAGEEAFIGQFTKSTFNQNGVDTVDGLAGYVFVDFDVDTSVTLALIELVNT